MNPRILPAFGSMLLLNGAKFREIEASKTSKYCKMIRYNKIFIMAIITGLGEYMFNLCVCTVCHKPIENEKIISLNKEN